MLIQHPYFFNLKCLSVYLDLIVYMCYCRICTESE